MVLGQAAEGAGDQASDLHALGPAAVRAAFANQIAFCEANDAPITASICAAVVALLHTEGGGAVMRRIGAWPGAALADALPLRIAGGLHALHLSGTEPELAQVYAGQAVADLPALLAGVLERHERALLPWLDGPPQTNEAGRSWAYAAAMLWLARQGCPGRFHLLELGSSAGINLMLDRFRFDLGGVTLGPADPVLTIAPEWRGPPPPDGDIAIVSAEGCDVAPVDLTDPSQALRLRAYIWPEHGERVARMDAAVAAARARAPEIARQSAGAFVARVLARPAVPRVTRVIAHSVVWQYIPAEERRAIAAAIEAAGARATVQAPLAWIMLEANRDTHRHELTVRFWPGGAERVTLATAHPHGSWVEWQGQPA